MNIYSFNITIRINWKAVWKNCTNIVFRKNATSVAHYMQDPHCLENSLINFHNKVTL